MFVNAEGVTVRNCNILRNKADELGGGICDNGEDDLALYSCSVCANVAWESEGADGGIYVHRFCDDIAIHGPTIIRGNRSQTFEHDNLYLSTDGYLTYANMKPATTIGADVHIRLSDAGPGPISDSSGIIYLKRGTYNASHFTYDNRNDNDPNYYVGWDSDWTKRQLRLIRGEEPQRPEPTIFTPDSEKRTQTVDGGYQVEDANYPLIKGISAIRPTLMTMQILKMYFITARLHKCGI